jgi:hypothetical protein
MLLPSGSLVARMSSLPAVPRTLAFTPSEPVVEGLTLIATLAVSVPPCPSLTV